ncbi:MAG: sarcosine oxidase subunit alpha family protein [Rhodospirillaceae bacterium]|nr:sarcosine oxidase subunit alpha family protein [Rhodospirillaceae bacterium]
MSTQIFRNDEGGLIDRTKPLSFTYDGKRYQGYQGDTLASALLANGVRLVGRSFKYHRPRGIFGAGIEEPNALVQLRTGARTEPNMQATRIELYDGLVANSQNCWPNVHFDLQAINNAFQAMIPSGFYYKTFMWPAKLWMTYERVIRNAAGMGKTAEQSDPDTYAHRYAHCDVLIAGGGPTGLVAALAAAKSGARVILADDGPEFGGMALGLTDTIGGNPGAEWARDTVAELAGMENVTLLRRTMVSSYYDHNMLILNERVADHLPAPAAHQPRQRLWQVRATEVVLATGSLERPLVFADNDRPGIMLASAAQTYANKFGVRAGERAVVFTNNGSAYTAACEMAAAGIEIQAIVDVRNDIPETEASMAKAVGIGVLAGYAVVAAHGAKAVHSVSVAALDTNGEINGDTREVICDLVAVSGGWTPSVHLLSQSRGKLRYDEDRTTFVPKTSFQRERSAGAANGSFALGDCLAQGLAAGTEAATAAGFACDAPPTPSCADETPMRPTPVWAVPFAPNQHGKRFVDLQNDVTAEDIALAHRENYISVEHLKRYTTLGMGTDQGRTSNVNGLALMAAHRGEAIPAVGTTTFRQPFSPITLGAVAGFEAHGHMAPTRATPMYTWHQAQGSDFAPAGYWLRAQYYQRPGEAMWPAIWREAKHVREKVGIVDVSTLGKIDLQGADAAEFLNRVYINGFAKLPVGKSRYGVMLREDGLVFDDGTVTRVSENRYLITTTTTHAGPVMVHLENLSQVHWPELDVKMVSVTDDWAGIAVAGPDSRTLLEKVCTGVDLSNDACPFMAYREGEISGAPLRLFRISFSGELAYEINVPADYGLDVWETLLDAGRDLDVIPYGTEAMNILRIEKGHVVGNELDGRTTADDAGFGRMMSGAKPFVGQVMAGREDLVKSDRRQLVGLIPADKTTKIPRGAQIVADPKAAMPMPSQGEVTSQCTSPNLGHPIGLALVENARQRHGETLYAHSPLTNETIPVTLADPIFIDPKGDRLHG